MTAYVHDITSHYIATVFSEVLSFLSVDSNVSLISSFIRPILICFKSFLLPHLLEHFLDTTLLNTDLY